jgi:hypothetical protein
MAKPFGGPLDTLAAVVVLLLCWVMARWQYVLVDNYPGVGKIPRVDVRELEKQGTLPHATLSECVCHNIFCCRCGRCGDTQNRDMRLTAIQHASAATAGSGYSGLPGSSQP